MEEIKVGEYIRTDNGQIFKVLEVEKGSVKIKSDYREWIGICCVIKHSINIIDLIEVCDYVNGLKITSIFNHNGKNKMVYAEDGDFYLLKSFKNNQIKSIVTREMFESIEYKVGD